MVRVKLGLGMAALGRPGYITLRHGHDGGTDPSPDVMERSSHFVLDATDGTAPCITRPGSSRPACIADSS